MRKLLLLLSFGLISLAGFSQNLQRYNWYFGSSNQAIRFNRTSGKPAMVTKAVPFGTGGSSTGTSPANTNLLFYTDGQVVYDASHVQMPAGSGLTASTSSNQPTAICPVPGNPGKYFIFLNTANAPATGTITARVIDMTQPGNSVFPGPALGDLEAPILNTGLITRAEGMMVVPHANGTDFWLITQQANSLTLTSTLINAAAYTSTFTNTTATIASVPITAANLSYHDIKKKIAVSPQDTNTDAIIVNFDDTAGTFTFDRTIFNSGLATTTNQSIYDIEWSISGDYLYLSRYGEPGVQADLLQYDYQNPTTTLTSVLPATVFRSFGVQMAPDSNIYHLYQSVSAGPILIGRITKPDTIASEVKYQPAQLTATSLGGTQFSSFLPKSKVNLTVSFTFAGVCQRNNTTFFPDVQPGADSLQWDFGDGTQIVSQWSPIHKFDQAITYNVKLTAFYQGQSQSTTQAVTIAPFQIQLNLVQDTTACRSEFPPPRGTSSPKQFSVKVSVTGGTPTSYLWSNGDTGPTLTPDSAGYYYVVVSDGSGCSAYAGVNVKEYGLQDQRRNVWYFGNKAGIDFNVSPPKALSNSAMNAPEGCAIMCDRNGKALFYTDGDNVYDKNDALIASGIGGDPLASQSSIIVPAPGDETLYYIFTNEAINGASTNTVQYSIYDVKANGGLGGITKQNQKLFSKSTERITASGKWLVIHEYGNNTFRVYPITDKGIGDPILTAIGSDHSFLSSTQGEGYMKLGPKNTIAVALSTPGVSNLVELFHLNDTTGKISHYQKLDLKQSAGQIYGVEFSPGGNKVYATIKGAAPFNIFEYFIDSIGHAYYRNKVANTSGKEIGAIQLAPNGQIYFALDGSTSLGTVQPIEDTTMVSPITFNAFALAAGTNSRLGLPNFIQQVGNGVGGPGFTFTGVCLGSPTKFVGTPTDAIDKFFWTFGDGGTDTQGTPEHTYATANTFTVSMNLTNRCGLDTTIVKPVTIFAPPPTPLTTQGAVALCTGPVTLDANTGNLPGILYAWSTGATTKTILVTKQSIIRVTITDTNGCTAKGQSLIADNQPQVDLGPDKTLCQNAAALALDAQNPGATYSWTVNGASTTTAQTRALDTTVPGTFDYKVVVTDPITTCSKTDNAIFTIIASPVFTLNGTNPTTCNGTDGTLQLQLSATTPPTGPYSVFVTGPGGYNQQAVDQAAPQLINYTTLKAGVYSGVVNDQISGCTIFQSFGLTDAPFTGSAASLAPNCDPVTVQVTTNAVATPLQYTITNNGTGVITGPVTGIPTPVFNTSPVTAGTYTIQVQDNAGCILAINNVAVVPNAPVAVTITPNVCATPPTILASGATTYAWTGPGIVGPSNAASITVSGQGTFTYTVVGSSPGNCDNTQTVTVTLDNSVPDFTQSDPCQDQVILSAAPSGTYTYRWLKGGTFQPALLGQFIQLGLTENGASYQVELQNTLNGCTYRSTPAKVVAVNGAINATLTATPACDDNKPFTLTSSTLATGVSYAWFYNNAVITGETNPTTSQTKAGTYRVDISKVTCKASAQLTIIKAPLPVGSLPDRAIICNDPENHDPTTNQIDLDPGKFVSYDWFKNDLSLGYTGRVYNTTSQGKFRVDLTNSFGCTAPDNVEVLNECLPKIDAPNAFRPSSSISDNTQFSVFTFFISSDNFQVFIYNRWGELVYTSSDRYFKWNGGMNNSPTQPLPGGAYAYIIKYTSSFHPERGTLEYRGGVALLR